MSIRAFMPVYNACIFGHLRMIQQRGMTDDRAAQSPQAAPQSSFSPWSVSISRILLQAGHPLPAPNSLVSPHIVHQTQECRRKSSWSLCVQHIDFFSPYSHFISLLSCGFILNCDLGKTRIKLSISTIYFMGFSAHILFLLWICAFHSHSLVHFLFFRFFKRCFGVWPQLSRTQCLSDESNW